MASVLLSVSVSLYNPPTSTNKNTLRKKDRPICHSDALPNPNKQMGKTSGLLLAIVHAPNLWVPVLASWTGWTGCQTGMVALVRYPPTGAMGRILLGLKGKPPV